MFVKLETLVYKIFSTTEARKKLRVRKAFNAFLNNARAQRIQEKKLAHKRRLVLTKFDLALSGMCDAF